MNELGKYLEKLNSPLYLNWSLKYPWNTIHPNSIMHCDSLKNMCMTFQVNFSFKHHSFSRWVFQIFYFVIFRKHSTNIRLFNDIFFIQNLLELVESEIENFDNTSALTCCLKLTQNLSRRVTVRRVASMSTASKEVRWLNCMSYFLTFRCGTFFFFITVAPIQPKQIFECAYNR